MKIVSEVLGCTLLILAAVTLIISIILGNMDLSILGLLAAILGKLELKEAEKR